MPASSLLAPLLVSDEPTLRQDLVSHGARLAASGLSQGTSGNLSARCGDGFLITPSGTPYEDITAQGLVMVDRDGRWPAGLHPSSEWRFHRDIYLARPDAGAIVHVHPPYATALAMCRRDIPPAHYMIAVGGGDSIRCAGYHTYGTQALSDAVLAALEDRLACLMANHGMIALGATLAQAMWRAVEVWRPWPASTRWPCRSASRSCLPRRRWPTCSRNSPTTD